MIEKSRTVASLFSGAGGFDWGFHRAGFKTQLAIELKKYPAETLAHNLDLRTLRTPITLEFSDLPAVVQGDVRDVDFSCLPPLNPDVLIGGPPCQDFSLSKGSKREGLNGGRGKLYLQFLRALMFLQPRMFVFENVPGFTSANGGLAYQTVLDDLQNLDDHRQEALAADQPVKVPQETVKNYVILFSDVVDAVAIGVPQTRRRLIIIGLRTDLAASFGGLDAFLRNSISSALTGSLWNFSRYPLSSIEIFEGQPLCKLQDKYRQAMECYRSLAEGKLFPKVVDWCSRVWNKLTFDIVKDYYTANLLNYESDHDPEAFAKAMQEHEDLLAELGWLGRPVHTLEDAINGLPKQSSAVKDRMFHIPPEENAEFVDGTQWQVQNKEISFIYRRPAPLKPAWTVMAHGGGGTYGYHYERNRQMLTLRERARIQTFSDEFDFKGLEVRSQIGEAVPPLLGERIANAVKLVLNQLD